MRSSPTDIKIAFAITSHAPTSAYAATPIGPLSSGPSPATTDSSRIDWTESN